MLAAFRAMLSGGYGGQRLAGVGTDALDHGAQPVGALWRQMLAEAEFVEYRDGVGGQNLPRRVPGKQRQQDRDQPAHDMGVAVAEVVEQGFAAECSASGIGTRVRPSSMTYR